MYTIIDLNFQNKSHLIAAYLIKTQEGAILIETGPYSCHSHLSKGIKNLGLKMEDIKKILLTHIHLDHSGGAWALAQTGSQIFAHPLGVPHLVNPDKLVASATMIYREKMGTLWSDLRGIASNQVTAVADQDVIEFTTPQGERKKIIAHHTPGHARHHIAYELDGTLFSGDVLGLQIENSPTLMPSPPPEIDLLSWRESIRKIETINPQKIALTHFGVINDSQNYLKQCSSFLTQMENWFEQKIKEKLPTEAINKKFIQWMNDLLMENSCSQELSEKLELINPSYMSNLGFLRYFKKFRNMGITS